MPTVSEFYGIRISMYWNDFDRHKFPHFHAYYGEYEGSFKLNGDMIVGNMPVTAQKLIKKWAVLNLLKINYNWNRVLKALPIEKIEGLN